MLVVRCRSGSARHGQPAFLGCCHTTSSRLVLWTPSPEPSELQYPAQRRVGKKQRGTFIWGKSGKNYKPIYFLGFVMAGPKKNFQKPQPTARLSFKAKRPGELSDPLDNSRCGCLLTSRRSPWGLVCQVCRTKGRAVMGWSLCDTY